MKTALVTLPINDIPSRCLIDSGSVISLMHTDYAAYLPSQDCDLKIVRATGHEEQIKKFSNVKIRIGEDIIETPVCHSKSSMI